MSTSEKLCLRWNDFQENVNSAFLSLRKDNDFTDVTLACEDGHQVDAHKVILAASSPFFENLLKRNKHAHPLIYMRGMKSEDLLAIVDFLYYGEANIYQENLDTFLNIAEELKLEGLKGNIDTFFNNTNNIKLEGLKVVEEEGGGEGQGDCVNSQRYILKSNISSEQKKIVTPETKITSVNNSLISISYSSDDQLTSTVAGALPKQEISGELKGLDKQIETMIICRENVVTNIKIYNCKVCGKEDTKSQIRDHIEAKHLEGISIPCNLCEKNLRSRRALRRHMKTHTAPN